VAEAAHTAWRVLHEREREYWQVDGMPLPLKLEAVRGLAHDYGLSLEMRELILTLDEVVTDMLQREHKRRAKERDKGRG
jgi:hypothetical protein